ncbi:hypothetical protein CJJ07_000134 [Candidozyma auris]|nr:hypothetical protein CJJ07_000134 [[Candida] auris]QEL59827.1 hypothetical protein CJJ09_001914 [[Candida] auris]
MCSRNYKSYQQVLNLGCDKKSKAAKQRVAKPTVQKRRTKTGCMTCRRRKKKCDEHKVGGKCQACIRNFLDCHWPGEEAEVTENKAVPVPSSPELLTRFKAESPVNNGADAYPSPVMSPKAESVEHSYNCMDIKSLTLPPISEKVVKSEKVAQEKSSKPETKKKNIQGEKFFIASFDSGKSLCQIKA